MTRRRRPTTRTRIAACAALAWSSLASGSGILRSRDSPMPSRALPSFADPCLQCDILYVSDCGTGLWAIDTTTASSRFVGNMAGNMFDLSVTWDGRLVGVDGGGGLWEVSAC